METLFLATLAVIAWSWVAGRPYRARNRKARAAGIPVREIG